MMLGRVVGTVVATRKEKELEGLKMLLIRAADAKGVATGGLHIAIDAVGAGEGDVVLTCSGSSARQTAVTRDRPVDAVVMAIVDQVAVGNELTYNKD